MTMTDDPLAPAGAQFPLARPETAPPSWDEPSPVGVRPWGLRRMGPVGVILMPVEACAGRRIAHYRP